MKALIDDTLCKGILQPYGIILHAKYLIQDLRINDMYARMLNLGSNQLIYTKTEWKQYSTIITKFYTASLYHFFLPKSTLRFKI